jgi:hypothetical protein
MPNLIRFAHNDYKIPCSRIGEQDSCCDGSDGWVAGLFVTQCFNRVHLSCLSGRKVAEDDAHRGREYKGDDDNPWIKDEGNGKKAGSDGGRHNPEDDADHPA